MKTESDLTRLLTRFCAAPCRLFSMKFSRFLPLGLSLLLLAPPAQAVNFGGLNVTPRGAQNLNLETGATDMPSGGTATDTKGGLTLTAERMQLKPNEVLSAQGATVKIKRGGTLTASNVVYDLKAGTVTATGNVSYSDARMTGLTAPSIVLHVKSGFVVASGGVKASKPTMTGSSLVFDPNTMQAAMAGPYKLNTRLGNASGAAGSKLLMTFGGNLLLSADPKPGADDLARFNPYLK